MFYGYNDGYMGLAWYEEDLDNEYKERTGYGFDGTNESGIGANDLRNDPRNNQQKTTKEIDK